MATEADIPAPICETRGEQGETLVDQATKISISKLPQEEQSRADTHSELPTVEGENFLRTPSIGEVHCEINNDSPDVSKVTEKPDQTVKDDTDILHISHKLDDQQVEIDANEETSSVEIQQNAGESNGLDKEEHRGVVPVQYSTDSPVMTSEMKAGDILHDPDLDNVQVEAEQSKDITRDHHGTNDSFTEKIALEEELEITNLPSGETKESNTGRILEGEDLNAQVKTMDEKAEDKKTEENVSCNVTSDLSKEGECDQNNITLEQEELGNERNWVHNSDTAAEKESQENRTFTESIACEAIISDELQDKNDLYSSFRKEEDISVQEGDRSVTTSGGSEILLEKTLSESHGCLEYQSKTLEGTAASHSDPNPREKSEESSFIQVDDSQIEQDEQLEEETEKLALTEVSSDNVSAAIDIVKDEDDFKEAALSEKEPNTSSVLKEDVQIENPPVSFNAAPENIKAPNLGQEDNIKGSPEEQSINPNLHENTGGDTEEKPIDAVYTQKEIHESFSTIVPSSPEERSINAVLQEVASDHTDEKIIHEVHTEKEVLENFSTTVSNEDVDGNSTIKSDGKESQRTSLPLPLAREVSDNESMLLLEARIEDEESRKAEFCENEKNIESTSLTVESKIEKPEDSLHAISEDNKAPDLGQEIETKSFIEEQSVTTDQQEILNGKTEDKTVDIAEIEEETLENFPTIVPNEKMEEKSLIQVDSPKMKNEEHLEKESGQPSLVKDFTGNANNDQLIVADEVKIEDESTSRAEFFIKDKNKESALLKEEVQKEKPVGSLHAAFEDIKASDFCQDAETTGSLKEQSLTENPQGSLGDKTEEKTIEASTINEKTQELQNVSNEVNDKDSLIKVDASETEHDAHLEEEIERPSSTEASKEDANDGESNILLEQKTDDECLRKVELFESEKNTDGTLLKKENLQDASEDHKASASIEDIETTCSLEKPSLVMSERTTDATNMNEVTLEVQNVATEIPHEHAEENTITQVEFSQMKHKENLEKDNENSSLTATEETNADESKNIHESEKKGVNSIKPESENEKNSECTSVKEETQVEKPIDSLQAAVEDIEASDSSYTNSSTMEQILTADPPEISSDKTEKESVEDIATNIPDEDNEDNSPIEEDGSQKPSLEEASTRNNNDEESTIMHEANLAGENEKNIECTLLKEQIQVEKPTESSQVATEDIKESASCQETSSIEEQILTSDPQEISRESAEGKTIDAAYMKENLEQNVATEIPQEHTEENSVTQVDCSQMEHEEFLEKENENSSLTDAPTEEINADKSKDIHETEKKGIDSIKAELGNEKNTECKSVKKEAQVDKPIDSLQAAAEAIKESDSSCTNSYTEEKILTADPQEISSDKTEKESIDAADKNEQTLEAKDIATNIPDGDKEDNSPIEKDDGSQKPSSEEASTRNSNDEEPTITHEAEPAGENEKNIGCTLVNEEVSIESLQVVAQDVKASASGQVKERSSLEEQSVTTNPQGITGDNKEDKTNSATNAGVGILEDKLDIAKTTPYEDIEENLPIQVDCSQLEQNKDLENDNENASLTVAPIGGTTESTLVKEEAQVEKPIDLPQVATKDIKASTSCQETSSIKEQILTADPQEISCERTEGKTIDAAYMKESLENAATEIPHDHTEENSVTQMDCSKKEDKEHLEKDNESLSLADAPTKETNPEESKNIHEPENKSIDSTKAESENEKNTECTSVKEVAELEMPIDSLQAPAKDIKATDSSYTNNSTEKQILTADPQEISSDCTERESIDAADRNEESPEDIATNIPGGGDENNSIIEEDGSQKPSFEEAPTGNSNDKESTIKHEEKLACENKKNTEGTLVKEEVSIESLQVPAQDIKEFASGQDKEISSLEEQSLTTNPQGIIGDNKEDKTNDATGAEGTTPEDKNIAKATPYEDIKENLLVQVDCSRFEQNKDLENDNENTSFTVATVGDTRTSSLFKEEAQAEKRIDLSQVATKDIEASPSCQETSFIEEQVLTANPQEFSCDRTEEKTIEAAYTEESPEDVAISAPSRDNEDKPSIKVEGSQKPSLEEAAMGNTHDDESTIRQEAKFANENTVKADLFENKKNIECAVVTEEVSLKSLQVANEDVNASASDQDRETSHLEEQGLTTNPQGIMGDYEEDKPIDVTDLKEETPEDKNDAVLANEDTEEHSLTQVDCSQIEQKEHLEKESEKISLAETPTGCAADNNLKGEGLPVVDGVKASISSQDKEISSIEAQVLTTNAQEISCYETEGNTIDASYTKKEILEDMATNFPDGENETKEDGSQKSSLEEASIGNEENTEGTFAKEEVSIESLQVATENIKASASDQDRETLEEQSLTTDCQDTIGGNKEDKINDAIGVNEETPEDKNYTTTSQENTKEETLIQVDCSQLEHNEHSEKDSESISLTEPLKVATTEGPLVKEDASVEDRIDSLQVATTGVKAFAPCQDTETSSTEEQLLAADPENISRDKTIEEIIDKTDKEETLEVQDVARTVLHGDNEDNLSTKENCSQEPSLEEASTGNANNHESIIMHETEFLDESLIKADIIDFEKDREGTLVKEDISIESSQVAAEDIKASSSSEDRETNPQEEQILNANRGGLMGDKSENKTIDPIGLEKETPKDEVPKEIENVNVQATNIKEEEGHLKDLQMTTAVYIAAHEEKGSSSVAAEISREEDSDVNEDVMEHIPEDPNCHQEESSITKLSEENIVTSNENVPDVTGLASEVSEPNSDQKFVEEANNCLDEIDTDKTGVLDDGSITIPTNETSAETDPRECTEAEVQSSNGEKDAEIMQQDPVAETDQKDIEEEQPITVSPVISESKELKGEEEEIKSNSCKEMSGSSNSVALEEDSTSKSIQEPRIEKREEADIEEAQKQEEEVHVSAVVQDSSMEIIEKDVQLSLANANDSVITQEMQKLEEAPLPAPDENKTETTDCKESEVSEDATKNKCSDHMEQDDTTKSFSDDKTTIEIEQEEREGGQEKAKPDEKVELTKSTSTPEANDYLPLSVSETPVVDHITMEEELTTNSEEPQTQTSDNEVKEIDKDRDDEVESSEHKISDVSLAAPNMIEERNQDVATLMSEVAEENIPEKFKTEANNVSKTIDTTEGTVINESTSLEGILVKNGSIIDLENKIDDEASKIIETIPTATEGQDVESTSAGETSVLIAKCEGDEYEHAHIGHVIEEKSDSNEVPFAPGEHKTGYESKHQLLESIAQSQSCDIISEAEERTTEEGNLEAAAAIKSEKDMAKDIFEQEEITYEKEIIKENISSEKVQLSRIKEEDKDVEEYHQGSCKEEVTTESHLEDKERQEEEIHTEEISGVIKNENEIEKMSSKKSDDEALEEPGENLLANESIDRSLQQKEQAKSVQEVTYIFEAEEPHGLDIACVKTGSQDSDKEINSSNAAFPEEEDNRTGADDTDNEVAKDEGSLNQNSNISVIDAAARKLPKGRDENIICEAPPANTAHKTVEVPEANQENANTTMTQQQEEGSTSKHEILPLPELAQGKESEELNQKDEICSLAEVQAKDEENLVLSAGKSEEENKADNYSKPNEDEDRETNVEAEQLEFSSHAKDISEVTISDAAQDIPKDKENSTTKYKSSEEEYPNKSAQCRTSTSGNDIEEIEQASEAIRITAEVQEPKAGIDSGAAVPQGTGVESRQLEEVNDKYKVMAAISTTVEPSVISTSNIIAECAVGTLLEAKDQQTKLHDLPHQLNIGDSEVKMAEKDDPVNLQNVRDISEDVQELNKGSFKVSNEENPVEADPDENIEPSEENKTEATKNPPMSETLKQETEKQQLKRTYENVPDAGVTCEEEKLINDKSSELENICRSEKEKVSESNIHQSSVEDTAQDDKYEVGQRQIDSLPILPHAKCSGIETAEKDLPVHVTGLDGTDEKELKVTPLPLEDKLQVVLEADHTKNLNLENPSGNKNISALSSQGEHEIPKSSRVEQEEADCGNEERTDQEMREKPESKETNKPSLSDLFETSMRERETSQMATYSAAEKEPTTEREDLQAEKTDEAENEDAKTDEEKDDEEESSEQRRLDLGAEAPVMVDMGDADVKVSHKKSHNILSGVGSKVKHSIAKVKKAITGKSSHPKPPSPKKVIT